ncbi:hypothetical protein CFRS1_v015882 [Colletotrichum fructicola]|nr:hypothetical protein CFRS1_v015882 [Colletotrichum fructicola]
MSILWTIAECVLKALWWPASIVIPIVLSFLLLAFLAGWAVEGLHACNMTHGGDFARVIRPEFDRRLVRHYAKTWVTTDAYGPVVFTDKIVVNEDIGKEYRFNRELVETCFNDVDAVERWLRVEMGKQDCFRPWYHAVHAGHYSEASRANDADDTYDADTEPAPCGYRLIHAHGPIAKAAADAKAPQEKPECPSPSGLFSDPASGLAGGTRMGQAPAAASPVPAKDGIPALGPALWGPTTPLAAAPSPGMFPPTPVRSLASTRAPSITPPSSARWVFASLSPGPRHPPPPTTILTDGTRSVAPSTSASSAAPLPSIHSSLLGRFKKSFTPPPPPTTILAAGATDVMATAMATAVAGMDGVESGAETWESWEDRVRGSFEAKAIMIGIDVPVRDALFVM